MTDLQMLTQEEVATLLHTSVDNVAMLRRVGVLPSIKTGRNYMFSQASIRRFQSDYEGCDVSSMESAKVAKHDVEGAKNVNHTSVKEAFKNVDSPTPIFGVTGGATFLTDKFKK